MTHRERVVRGRVLGVGLACIDESFLIMPSPTSPFGIPVERVVGLGGMATNALAAAAKLGCRAKLQTLLADDPVGERIRALVGEAGIDHSGIAMCNGGRSPTTIVVVDGATGERSLIPQARALSPISDPGDPLDLEAGDVLLVDGFHEELALDAVQRARRTGVPVIGDLWLRPAQRSPLLEWVDSLILCESVGRRFSSDGSLESALCKLTALGPRLVAITLGASGLIYTDGGSLRRVPAPVVKVVDTSGAGDALHGAFAFGLLMGWSPRESLEFAVVAASLNCRCLGPQLGLPSYAQVVEEMTLLGTSGPWQHVSPALTTRPGRQQAGVHGRAD